jgi:hypothetical protein
LRDGGIVTESSQVENIMLSIVIVCQRSRPIQKVLVDFMGKTFGEKNRRIQAHLRCLSIHRRTPNNSLRCLCAAGYLAAKRNFIVHGTTYQIGMESIPAQPYRIGMTRGDFDNLAAEGKNRSGDERINAVGRDGIAMLNSELAGVTRSG